jgi:hypothetical protein
MGGAGKVPHGARTEGLMDAQARRPPLLSSETSLQRHLRVLS